MPKPRRILLHPGFHKTGTSSIQHFFWLNRDLIHERAHLFMLRHMKPATQIAHRYSRTGNPLELADLVDRLTDVFAETPDDDRDILISCEALCGHLPGWPKVDTYVAAPVIIDYTAEFLKDRFQTKHLEIVLTTRGADDWLFSAYRHHLKGQRLTLDWDDYRTRYAASTDFAPVFSQLRGALGDCVTDLPLEHSQTHAFGPGGALLNLFGWTDLTGFTPVGRGNQGPEQSLWSEFLTLNRSDLSDDALRDAKDTLAQKAQLGGWRRT
ncbi:hypothetical protein BVC71_01715 [Marivivens niveibacter]|uniref:Sulfotransferase family protein n=1 Tax=Marivivens niveibacter TaxID=1930667 RepID=A0A251X0Z4_9RHOB|nr:hypothetical protein [Marivivens niveibacter]OUD10256.1 hypothetical protein BVC71_01715 [Marivivens niveibacter]